MMYDVEIRSCNCAECSVGCIAMPVLVFCKSGMHPESRMQSLRCLLLVHIIVILYRLFVISVSRDSAVGIAIGYGLDD
jgi:hypothetical protein